MERRTLPSETHHKKLRSRLDAEAEYIGRALAKNSSPSAAQGFVLIPQSEVIVVREPPMIVGLAQWDVAFALRQMIG